MSPLTTVLSVNPLHCIYSVCVSIQQRDNSLPLKQNQNIVFSKCHHKNKPLFTDVRCLAHVSSDNYQPQLTSQQEVNRLNYLWVVQSHRVACPKRNCPSTTPRNNIWCPVRTASNMACLYYRRRHVGSWSCGVTVKVAVVETAQANIGSTSCSFTARPSTVIIILFNKHFHSQHFSVFQMSLYVDADNIVCLII